METTLALKSNPKYNTFIVKINDNSGIKHLVQIKERDKEEKILDEHYFCNHACFFYIPGKYFNCVKKTHYELSRDVKCDEKIDCFKKVDVHYLFELLYNQLKEKQVKVYTSIQEIHHQLLSNLQYLYIQVYNPLLTKDILSIIRKPSLYGYNISLNISNDKLTIKYIYDS